MFFKIVYRVSIKKRVHRKSEVALAQNTSGRKL